MGLLSSRILAGLNLFSVCTQGLRPGLIYFAPAGAYSRPPTLSHRTRKGWGTFNYPIILPGQQAARTGVWAPPVDGLGFYAYVADAAYYVVGRLLVVFYWHYFYWVGLILGAEDQIISG